LARFCPISSVAPVLGDCEDGGGVGLEKDNSSIPLERPERQGARFSPFRFRDPCPEYVVSLIVVLADLAGGIDAAISAELLTE
jgi:hypothetical protein